MKSAADLVQEHLHYMTTDLTKWRALFNENAIWEFAYGPSAGVSGTARGIVEIAQRVEGFLARVDGLSYEDLKIYQIDRVDAVFRRIPGPSEGDWYRPPLSSELCCRSMCRGRKDRFWSRVLRSDKSSRRIFLGLRNGLENPIPKTNHPPA